MKLQELMATGMSEVEACKVILANAGLQVTKKREVKRVITVNKNGGLFFKDPEFKAWSAKKSKEYIAGINMDMKIARQLFNNPELLEEIREFINQDDAELETLRVEKEAKKALAEQKKSLGLY